MKTAIFGFSGSGKSSLFAAMAGPVGTHSDRAMIKVPEPRLEPLAQAFQPKKVTFSEIEVVDIPGGGGKGQGLGERVLNAIRSFDCLLGVIDGFSGMQPPQTQFDSMESDLILSDMAVIEKKLEKMELDKRKSKLLVDPKEEELLCRARDILEEERPLRTQSDIADCPELRGYCFLSAKPILYAWNVDEASFGTFDPPSDGNQVAHVAVSARLEQELAELSDPEDRQLFLAELDIRESALDRIIAKTYSLLGLITFLTAGEKEVRAWPLRKGSTAPEAAGVIHSDLQKGFIRAEVLRYDDFLQCKDFKTARDKGLLRLEGKDYIVQDGDIITFRFNV